MARYHRPRASLVLECETTLTLTLTLTLPSRELGGSELAERLGNSTAVRSGVPSNVELFVAEENERDDGIIGLTSLRPRLVIARTTTPMCVPAPSGVR